MLINDSAAMLGHCRRRFDPWGTPLLKMLRAVAVAAATIAAPSASHAATLDQMAGQMILLGFQGDQITDKSVAGLRD